MIPHSVRPLFKSTPLYSPWLDKILSDPVLSEVRRRMYSHNASDPLPFDMQVHCFFIGQLVDSPEELLDWCSSNEQWPLYEKIIERQAAQWDKNESVYATPPHVLRELRDKRLKQKDAPPANPQPLTTDSPVISAAPRLWNDVRQEDIAKILNLQCTLPEQLKALSALISRLSLQDQWLLDVFHKCQTPEDLDAFIALSKACPQPHAIGHFLFKMALAKNDVARFAETLKRFPILHLKIHLHDLDNPAIALEALSANRLSFDLNLELGNRLSTLIAPLMALTEQAQCGLQGVTLHTSATEVSAFALKPLATALNRCDALSSFEIINAPGHASSVEAIDAIWEWLDLKAARGPAMLIVKIFGPLGPKTQALLWSKISRRTCYGVILGKQDSFEALPSLLNGMNGLQLLHKPYLFAYETNFASAWNARLDTPPVPSATSRTVSGRPLDTSFDYHIRHSDYMRDSDRFANTPKAALEHTALEQLLVQASNPAQLSARTEALREWQSALSNFAPIGFQFSMDLFLPLSAETLKPYFSTAMTRDAIWTALVALRPELKDTIGRYNKAHPSMASQIHMIDILTGGSTEAFVQRQQSINNWLTPYLVEELQQMLKAHVPYEDLRCLDRCIGPLAYREKV